MLKDVNFPVFLKLAKKQNRIFFVEKFVKLKGDERNFYHFWFR